MTQSKVITACLPHACALPLQTAFASPSSYSCLCAGYMFNISLLKKVFAPNFTMHDMKRTGEYEVTSRWTMIMQFTLNRYSPLQRWWDPQLIFTGVSIMGVNPKNGELLRSPDQSPDSTCLLGFWRMGR